MFTIQTTTGQVIRNFSEIGNAATHLAYLRVVKPDLSLSLVDESGYIVDNVSLLRAIDTRVLGDMIYAHLINVTITG